MQSYGGFRWPRQEAPSARQCFDMHIRCRNLTMCRMNNWHLNNASLFFIISCYPENERLG